MRRPLLALALGAATALTGAGAVSAAPAAVGPVAVGWWSAARVDPAVPAVAPPDVGAHDLYVAGANALPPVAAPVDVPVDPPTAPGAQAIAALSFELPAGATARQLQLRLAGVHPPAVTFTACRALQAFETTYGGAWADLPTYDCRDAGTARLGTDGSVLVDGVDRLRRGRDLAVVLVPGPLDRVVVAAPDARTLTVTSSGGVSAPPPLPPAAPVAAAPVAPTAPLAGVAVPPLPGGAVPGAVPAPSSSPPVVSPPTPAAAATAASATLAARPWPALAATLLLATLAFVPLVRPRRGADAIGERGVGRFRSERSGSVPDLA